MGNLKKDKQLTLFESREDSSLDFNTYDSLRSLPKAELHRHLLGSIRFNTLIEIAKQYKIKLPYDKGEYDIKKIEKRVKFKKPVNSLERFILSPWRNFNRIIINTEVVSRLISEAIEDAQRDNVKYLELRVSSYGLNNGNRNKLIGFKFPDFLEALKNSIEKSQKNYPQIITKIIITLPRHYLARLNQFERQSYYKNLLKYTIDYKNNPVVGFDLAGIEKGYPPRQFKDFFREAKEAGYKITIHAGETDTPESIREAIELLQADRIAHGIKAMHSKEILDYIIKRNIPMEICPTSNILTGSVKLMSEHPIKMFFDAGVKVTINTDNPEVCVTSLTDEYYKLIETFAFSIQDIKKMILNGFDSAFYGGNEKKDYVRFLMV